MSVPPSKAGEGAHGLDRPTEEEAAAWDARYAQSGLVWHAEANDLLVEVTKDLPPGRAVDLGCGEGRNSLHLARNGWAVTGIDFSVVGIEKARRLAKEQDLEVDFVAMDVRSFRPEPQSLELAMTLYLHLLPEERRALYGAAAPGLRSGGRLVVIGHDLENFRRGLPGPGIPEVLLEPGPLAADLEALGLVIERAESVERSDHVGRDAVDTLVIARRT